jgi:Protein of unknown function (DUF4254)
MLEVDRIVDLHRECVARWHKEGADVLSKEKDERSSGIYEIICQQHAFNYQLWHEEDEARSPDASDTIIANVKRRIDRLNQQRNDWIEKIDDGLAVWLQEAGIQPRPQAPHNSETSGSICDRLSILALRLYHLEEQRGRADLSAELRTTLDSKLAIANLQLIDLSTALRDLIADLFSGLKRHKIYRQLKLYNDPNFNPVLYNAGRKPL